MLAGFDELINSAISECDINSRSIPLLNVEKERIDSVRRFLQKTENRKPTGKNRKNRVNRVY